MHNQEQSEETNFFGSMLKAQEEASFFTSNIKKGYKVVENYAFEQELGSGSFGNVHKVRDLETGAIFAMKSVPKDKINTKYMKDMLMTEISIMNQINHPNVLHLHKVLTSKNNYYMLMDFCDQGDLFNLIRSKPGKKLPEAEAVEFMKQIMNGFIEIRRHNVIHRDIKSENIFLKGGRAVIGDFGLAKQGTDIAMSCVGSWMMMAPELIRASQTPVAYNSKIDLWSLGIVFYEMLFGRSPFRFEDQAQILRDIRNGSGDKLRFPGEISENAKSLLRGLIRENPIERLDWNQFFNHPIFASNESAGSVQNFLPQEVVGDFWGFDFEFQENKKQNLNTLPSREVKPIEAKLITRIKAQEVESGKLAHLGILSHHQANEVAGKYLHERNKMMFVAFASEKVTEAIERGEVSDFEPVCAELALLLAKKAFSLAQKLVTFSKSETNIWNFDPKIFAAFLKSTKREKIIASFEADMSALDKRCQRIFNLASQRLANRIKYNNVSAMASNISSFDHLISNELMAIQNNANFRNFTFNPNSRQGLFKSLGLAKLGGELDRFFPYTDHVTMEKIDWSKLYVEFESKTGSEFLSILQI